MDSFEVRHLHDLHSELRGGAWPLDVWGRALACTDCALRVLLVLMNSQRWVIRRVENVSFHNDRTAGRRVSMEFVVPEQCPRYQVGDGQVVCVVPITVLRRATVFNFGLYDVEGNALSLMSTRETQAITEQIVLALADAIPCVHRSPQLCAFARDVAFGTQEQLTDAFRNAESGRLGPEVSRLLADPGASHLLRRLANNLILLVMLDETGPPRRIVRFSYDQPLNLTYWESGYDTATRSYTRPPRAVLRSRQSLLATLGWAPTVMRFATPSAENALTYRFEIEAPAGLQIASASLVAGRPNDDCNPPNWDHVAGLYPAVGLTAVDVPFGAMAWAQVAFRLSRRGWLTASLLVSILSTALLWATAGSPSRTEQAAAVATALLTITAALLVFVVRPGEHQVVNRLVTSVRAAATISMLLLIGVGSLITFLEPPPLVLFIAAGLATVCTGLVLLAWLRAAHTGRLIQKSDPARWIMS